LFEEVSYVQVLPVTARDGVSLKTATPAGFYVKLKGGWMKRVHGRAGTGRSVNQKQRFLALD